MTEKDLQDTLVALRKTRRKATASRAAALAYLMSLGIVDESGGLTPRYSAEEI